MLICILSVMNVFAQGEDWKLEKEKDGISVYTRQPEGTNIKEFKATVEIQSEIQFLVDMVLDVEEYNQWMDNIKSAEVFQRINDDNFFVYSEINVPWPMTNRDLITKNKVNRDANSGAVHITLKGMEGILPEKEGIIRMPEADGFWIFTPQKNGYISVVYQFLGDPGGSIPDWMINMFLVDGPYKSLTNMKRIAESR